MTENSNVEAASKSAALLQGVWQRNLPLLRDRLATLDRAAASAASGTLSRGLREDAAATAHKLAGSLGMFGYAEGTEIAREIEQLLDLPSVTDPQHLSRLVENLRRSLPL